MSNDILVVAEVRDGEVKSVTFEMLGKAAALAAQMGGVAEAALLGAGVAGQADLLAHYGAARVYLADDPALGTFSSEGYTNVLAGIVKQAEPAAVLMAASATGKDIAPRLAARLGVGLESDCTGFALDGDGRLLISRPIFAGKIIATVRLKSTPQMVTVRPNVLGAPEPDASRTATVEKVAVDVGPVRAQVIDTLMAEAGEVPLTEASIIVSGGRGVKGPEGFAPVRALAKALGGSVGSSRAAVDAGWIDHSHQVGQTGKTVTPNLYVACGISGAIQHLAGMKTSKVIVAINKDPEAPIFSFADYGIVGDLFEVVPLVEKEVRALLSQ
ncbi:MAG: electron transfer flavoprotein subunit alpha/FixB family protein [Chloroflexota bacterium]